MSKPCITSYGIGGVSTATRSGRAVQDAQLIALKAEQYIPIMKKEKTKMKRQITSIEKDKDSYLDINKKLKDLEKEIPVLELKVTDYNIAHDRCCHAHANSLEEIYEERKEKIISAEASVELLHFEASSAEETLSQIKREIEAAEESFYNTYKQSSASEELAQAIELARAYVENTRTTEAMEQRCKEIERIIDNKEDKSINSEISETKKLRIKRAELQAQVQKAKERLAYSKLNTKTEKQRLIQETKAAKEEIKVLQRDLFSLETPNHAKSINTGSNSSCQVANCQKIVIAASECKMKEMQVAQAAIALRKAQRKKQLLVLRVVEQLPESINPVGFENESEEHIRIYDILLEHVVMEVFSLLSRVSAAQKSKITVCTATELIEEVRGSIERLENMKIELNRAKYSWDMALDKCVGCFTEDAIATERMTHETLAETARRHTTVLQNRSVWSDAVAVLNGLETIGGNIPTLLSVYGKPQEVITENHVEDSGTSLVQVKLGWRSGALRKNSSVKLFPRETWVGKRSQLWKKVVALQRQTARERALTECTEICREIKELTDKINVRLIDRTNMIA